MLLTGTLLKGYGGFYYVYAADRVWECSLRGKLRLKKQDFLPGDQVEILPKGDDGHATVERVLPRRSVLTRPPVANVDLAVLVFALTQPEPDETLLNRLLVQSAHSGLETIIVLTKADLAAEGTSAVAELYRRVGYKVYIVSNRTGEGLQEVAAALSGRVAVLAGSSGVGKSSLLNALQADLARRTGKISTKLGRGRHTTRHVELLRVADGLVADTPGFSSYYLPDMKPEELQACFPEMLALNSGCRFKSCNHDREPECCVKEAVAAGEIAAARYEFYVESLRDLRERKPRY